MFPLRAAGFKLYIFESRKNEARKIEYLLVNNRKRGVSIYSRKINLSEYVSCAQNSKWISLMLIETANVKEERRGQTVSVSKKIKFIG